MAKKYDSFAAYLEDVYYNQVFDELKSYIFSNRNRINLSTYSVPDPNYIELSDFHIMGVCFHETENDCLEFRASVQTEIEISGRNRRDYESDSTDYWFSISFTAFLHDGLHDVRIVAVSEYSKERFKAEDSLTKYLIPYIYAKELDLHAEKFLKKYCPLALDRPMALPIKDILKEMGLTVRLAPLSDDVFGKTYFNEATAEVYNNAADRSVIKESIKPGTILVNPNNFFMRNIGSTNNTIIHECVHWDKHYKFFELQKLLNPEFSSISCAVVEEYKKGSDHLSEELSWMEWQANAIAPKILIPARTGRSKLIEILNRLNKGFSNLRSAYVMELAISEFADFFNVSTTAAKIRAVELGFEQAAGVFNFVDGRNYPPFSFAKGSLKKGQTFIIDRNNAIVEAVFNPDLVEDIKAGNFIHAGGMFVINAPKYVDIREGEETTLTEYALEHVDECCLVFDRTTRVSNKYDDSFYRICFLCRDANSKCFVEAKYNRNEGKNEDIQKRAREMSAIRDEAKRVQDIMCQLPSSFCGTLDYHINRRSYTNEKVEERSGISARTIQDYRNRLDVKPTLQSVLALCIGLNLQPAFSFDLITKAGYNIMLPSEEYLVYRYLINNHHMENIFMWNQKLQDAGIAQQLPKNGNKNTVQ
nr:MAG TPA: IrrE protein [Caudoviricetes sp.]